MQDIVVVKVVCLRCSWSWHPRKTPVRQCPKCKTVRWDQVKVSKKITEKVS